MADANKKHGSKIFLFLLGQQDFRPLLLWTIAAVLINSFLLQAIAESVTTKSEHGLKDFLKFSIDLKSSLFLFVELIFKKSKLK